MDYFIELGREQHLARAEVAAVLGSSATLVDATPHALILRADHLAIDQLQAQLGGTVKIGHVLTEWEPRDTLRRFEEFMQTDIVARPVRRVGISTYGTDWPSSAKERFAIQLKKKLKTANVSIRYITGVTNPLPSVLVGDQLLEPRGREYCLIVGEQAVYVGETVSVQPWKEWSHFDYNRPMRDARRGMLPPKLARIMLNLANIPLDAHLLDPFCGVGTVLQEAQRLGYTNLMGADRDSTAITATEQNLQWLGHQLVASPVSLEPQSIEELSATHAHQFDAVVTEADLGPVDLDRVLPKERLERFRSLRVRYVSWINDLANLLRPGGILVLAYPRLLNPAYNLDLETELQTHGWRLLPLVAPAYQKFHGISALSGSYARADQLIGRVIVRAQREQ